MSARTAAATPGYWTFTATSRPPSRSRARYTCPIEAAAIGSLVEGLEHRGDPLPRSRSITLRICLNDTVGAASRSFASSRWNSSRYSSGTSPTSRKDITWPSFIAAPFIVPNTDTICLAVSTWRRASAASAGLLAARHVGRARAELLHGLGRRQLSHRRRTAHPRPRDILLLAGHAIPSLGARGLISHIPPVHPNQDREDSDTHIRTRLVPPSGHPRRWTCEPGTMSSEPSGQRTHALCPPS